jgi:hypothetical protein
MTNSFEGSAFILNHPDLNIPRLEAAGLKFRQDKTFLFWNLIHFNMLSKTISPKLQELKPILLNSLIESAQSGDGSSGSSKAPFMIANLVGRDELKSSTDQLFVLSDHALNAIVEVIDATLAGKHDKHGTTWDLEEAVFPISNLSVSEQYQHKLTSKLLVDLLVRILREFGEGSNTHVSKLSVKLTSEALLNLVLGRESESAVNLVKEATVEPDLDSIVSQVIERIGREGGSGIGVGVEIGSSGNGDGGSTDDNNGDDVETVRCLNNLAAKVSGRLEALAQQADSNASSSSSSSAAAAIGTTAAEAQAVVDRRHVMLSYSWANKAQAIFLMKQLREAGYDVWRDEEGSNIFGPLSHGTVEVMAKAVEMSSIVLICVSEPYKQSANCKLEAEYATMMAERGRLEVAYLMFDSGYTTKSSPRFVDGWLGMQIGRQLWYGAFDEKMMQSSTVSSLVSKFGTSFAKCRVGGGASPATVAVAAAAVAGTIIEWIGKRSTTSDSRPITTCSNSN